MRKIILSTLVLFLFTSFSFAGNQRSDMGFLWWRSPRIVKELDLTSSQVSRIESIFQSYKGELKQYKKNIVQKQNKLDALLNDPNSEARKIKALNSQVQMIKHEARSAKVDMNLDIREVLTVEQRKKLRQLKKGYK